MELEYVSDGVRKTVYGKKLIISEGANASISDILGLNEGRIHYATAFVVKYFLEGIKDIEPNSWNLYYGKAYHTYSPAIIGPSLYGDNIFEMTLTGDKNVRPTDVFEKLNADSPLNLMVLITLEYHRAMLWYQLIQMMSLTIYSP